MSSTSRATVRFPSLLTSHPGISSLIMSTSVASTTTSSPSTFMAMLPLFSSPAISSWLRASITEATPFIIFPNFLPMVLKLHFTFFTSIFEPSTKSSSLTLTSFIISSLTASICRFCSSSVAGTIIF